MHACFRIQPMRPKHSGTTFAQGNALVTPEIKTRSISVCSLFNPREHVRPTPHVTLTVVPGKNVVMDERWDRGDYQKTLTGALRMGWC